MRQCPKCGERYADDLAYCPNDGTATTAMSVSGRPSDELLGTTIDGRYRIEARIGEGGMGVVYRASHVVLKKALAIKVMRGEQANDGEIVQRFVQEAQASSAIGHPNIIGISDFGTTADGAVYFAMEFLEGQTLGKAMERGPLSTERAINVFIQIAGALEAAHQRGIVHRDLKPDNIFLIKRGDNDDFVKVLDFGIAKVKNAAAKITRTGMVFGTPHYMSPEQAAGQTVDHRSDIYSLGVIMYQVFAGTLPFDAESYMGVITKHMYDPPPAPSSIVPPLRGSIEDIILMSLAKKPEQRYQTMIELRDDLELALRREPVRASEAAAVAGGATLGFMATALAPGNSDAPSTRPPVKAASTTLSELGTDEPLVLPITKRPAWLIPVVLGVLALGVLAMVVPSRDPDVSVVAPAAATDTANVLKPQPMAAGSDVAPKPQPTAAEITPPVHEAVREIHLIATPAAAELFLDDVSVGHGEAMVQRPTERVRLSVRLSGYFEKNVLLDAQSTDVIRVTLDPEPRKTSKSTPKTKAQPVAAPEPERPVVKPRRSINDVVDPWQ